MSAPGRVDSLEGLRGVAAVVVVAFHGVELLAVSDATRGAIAVVTLGGLLMNGPAAVHVFFVLSGYVLASSRARDLGVRDLAGYYVKRVLRIHPPYVGALLLSWLVSFVYLSGPLANATWPLNLGPVHIRPDQLGISLLFPSQAFWQLPVGWSLYVEMAMSLVFPLLLIIGRGFHPIVMLGVALWPLTVQIPWLGFGNYAIDFALGALLFLERERLARALGARPRLAAFALSLAGFGLLQVPNFVAWQRGDVVSLQHAGSPWILLSLALGSAVLVALAVHVAPARRWLSARPVLFLGRISYSVYLLHLTVLFLFAAVFGGRLPGLWGIAILGVGMLATLVLSAGFERWVEAPSQKLGRTLAGKLGGARDRPGAADRPR